MAKASVKRDNAPVTMKPVSDWRAFTVLLAKDLRQEFRTRDMLTSMGIYAILVLIVYGVALEIGRAHV